MDFHFISSPSPINTIKESIDFIGSSVYFSSAQFNMCIMARSVSYPKGLFSEEIPLGGGQICINALMPLLPKKVKLFLLIHPMCSPVLCRRHPSPASFFVCVFFPLVLALALLPLLVANGHSPRRLRDLLASIPEHRLDANRSVLISGERIFVPRRIPKLNRAEKRRLVAAQFARDGMAPPREFYETDWGEGQRRWRRARRHKGRRATTDQPWRIQYVVRRRHRPRISAHLQARNTERCPERLDAVTEAFNKRLYLFAGELVHEVWRDADGLQQRQAYAVPELFPDGPRRVTVAFTNQKSGVTVLLEHRTAYRFRWDKRHRRFYMARNAPRQLPAQMDFLPRIGFQWKDGHLILANHEKFVSYDPFWNLATFSSNKAQEYFPNLGGTVVGVAKHGRDAYLMMTAEGILQVYNMRKHKVELNFPLNMGRLLACLSTSNLTTTAAN